MRKVIIVLCLATLASGAFASELQVVPVPEGVQFENPASRQDCVFGNLNPGPYYYISGWTGEWIWIKLLVWPPLVCTCPLGFHLDNMQVNLYVDGTGLPQDVYFPIWIDLEDPWWWDPWGCWGPGDIDCEWMGEGFIPAATPGFHSFTIDMQDCACAYMEYFPQPPHPPYPYGPYLISIRIPVIYDPTLDVGVYPLTDQEDTGAPCTSFMNETLDMANWLENSEVFGGWTLDWIITADVTCCDVPIETQKQTWGGVKSLYK